MFAVPGARCNGYAPYGLPERQRRSASEQLTAASLICATSTVREQTLAQESQRPLRRALANLFAVTPHAQQPAAHAAVDVRCDPYGPDGLLGRAAVGAGDSGDRQSNLRTDRAPRPRGHLPNDFLAHGAVLGDCHALHAEHLHLHFVVVGDHAAKDNGARTADRREPSAQQPTRAALGDGDGETPRATQLEYDRREIVVVLAVDRVA